MSFIEVNGLSKRYKVQKKSDRKLRAAFSAFSRSNFEYVEAIKNMTFTVERKEIVGYIGPNGSGKSTTIKLLAGILQPDAGSCRVDGKVPWESRKEYVRNIGVMFGQRSQLLWDLPPVDSFEMLKGIYSIDTADYRARLSMLYDMLDLGELARKPVRQLSLGQRVRCELAATFLHNPKMVFLDEPTIGIDIEVKKQFHRFIKAINEAIGVTIFITTHDLDDIESLCDKLMIINHGELYYNDTMTELYNRYAIGGKIYAKMAHQGQLVLPSYVSLNKIEGDTAIVDVDPSIDIASAISDIAKNNLLQNIYAERPKIEDIILNIYKSF